MKYVHFQVLFLKFNFLLLLDEIDSLLGIVVLNRPKCPLSSLPNWISSKLPLNLYSTVLGKQCTVTIKNWFTFLNFNLFNQNVVNSQAAMTVNYDKSVPSTHMSILKSDWTMQYCHSHNNHNFSKMFGKLMLSSADGTLCKQWFVTY